MKRYVIRKLTGEMPQVCGKVFDPEKYDFCKNTPYAAIDNYRWDTTGYMPEARAYVMWSEKGLHVLLCANEETIRVKYTEFNGEVYEDSCLEFFLQPFANDPRYVNVETNAGGVALIGFGADRYDRVRMETMPEGMELTASVHDGGWYAVSYILPFELLNEMYGRVPKPGDVMRANFYKCDETIHPHYGTWSPICLPKSDFHQSKWFGEVEMEA